MRRGFGIALLVFQAVWLNVILPGHQRGLIVLPGSQSTESSHACCAAPTQDSAPKPDAPANRVSQCAICAFAARLSVPVAIDLNLSPLERLGIVADHAPATVVSIDLILAYHGRAPPAAV